MSEPYQGRPPQGPPPQGLPAQGGPSYPSSPGMAPVGPPPLPIEEYRDAEPPPSGAPPAASPGAPAGDGFDLRSTADTGPVPRVPDAGAPVIAGSVAAGPPAHKHSRTGAAWVALVIAAIVLVFLLIFVVQNSDDVAVRFLGWEGTLSLGVAMLFAAVAGALLAGLLGTVRIFQLRARAKRAAAAPAGSAGD